MAKEVGTRWFTSPIQMAAFAWFNAAPSHVRGGGLYPSRCERCVHTIRSALTVQEVGTVAIAGQKTGTSGLRKKTRILLDQPNYVCNWIQSLFNAIGLEELKGQTLILGGDGRFYNREAAQMMIRLAAGNGLGRVIVGQNALMTTPAVSAAIIRRRTLGGIIMTASHNPAGIDGDWGIKYNVANGSPATETLLDRVYENTITIKRYFLADLGGDVDVTTLGERIYGNGDFVVEVIDPAIDHILTLRECFDFEKLSNFIARRDFTFRFDAMHAASGPSARSVFVGELGASEDTMLNDQPLEDFGGGHPDPNLTYAKELVELLDPQYNPKAPDFGAASDGDGDRNMIVGQGFFVTPSDSLAVIADYAVRAIAHFRDGLKGVARSMPTSGAIDRIAARNGLELYETPTGWKYFGNLMDSGRISLCGEESFGTGSDHIREKDGIWAVLAWLSILSYRNENTPIGGLVTVEQIVREHWHKYGTFVPTFPTTVFFLVCLPCPFRSDGIFKHVHG